MSGKSTIDQIRHYQKDIEKCPDNAERMLRCIHRLYVLPITLEHLQETGVGRSVNSLRKYKGEVGDAAKALVTKWKAMVAAEESEEEPPPMPPSKPRENKVKSPPPVKSERKSDHHGKENKEKSKSKEISNNNNNSAKHHSHKKTSHEKSHSSNSSKSPEKNTDSKSSLKRSHSSSSSSHKVEKDNKSSNHKNSKTHHEKKHKIEDEENSPPPEKKHKSHSYSKDQSSKKRKMSSESEEESDASDKSEAEVESDPGSPAKDSEEESEVPSESSVSKSEAESDSNSDSDHRHRSKKHSSSHHNHKHSSHSKDRDKEKKKQKEQNHKEKEKNKENHSYNKHSEKHSSKKRSSSPDYKELIKENEKKIKKEKKEEFVAPKIVPSKPIKIETNEDGSIDSGSGASFADALLGMDVYEKKKCKKTTSSTSSSSSKSKSSKSSSSISSTSSKNEEKPKLSKPSSSTKSIDELVEPPELLTKTVKLEALDLDISSTLPEINPNYKPLPHVPERMRQPRFMSDEDHMFSIMSTKNQRTKVYSGNKSALTSVPTLFSMCIQLLYDNIDAVEYTGGVPYQLLKPLLQKLNADQLYVLEHFNPYLVEDTDELWKFHAQKEFRNEKRQDMESWRELYVRCMDERERKLKALTANITQSMANSTPVRQAKLAYVDAVVKPPRNIARKQAKFGTGNASSPTKSPTKHEIVSKAVVGGNTPGLSVKDTVPPPPASARAAVHHPTPALLKKKKAPLMQKALQVMKGTRYKR